MRIIAQYRYGMVCASMVSTIDGGDKLFCGGSNLLAIKSREIK